MLYDLTGATQKIGNVVLYEFVQPDHPKCGGWIDKPELLKTLKKSRFGKGTKIYGSKILRDIVTGENCTIAYSTIFKACALGRNVVFHNVALLGDVTRPAIFRDNVVLDNIELYARGSYDKRIEEPFKTYKKDGLVFLVAKNWVRMNCTMLEWDEGLNMLEHPDLIEQKIKEVDPDLVHSKNIIKNLD